MFTGIVEEVGTVTALAIEGEAARLEVGCETVLEGVRTGDSIAVDGCCLTVTRGNRQGFAADLMAETLRVTALGSLAVGDRVNLERALRLDGRLGGHLVQGHVDGVGEIIEREEIPGTVFLAVSAPPEVARYLVPKGTVALAGASLTVVDVDARGVFRVGLIPHTLAATSLSSRMVGDAVNLEVDVVAKYVERLLASGVPTPYGGPDRAEAGDGNRERRDDDTEENR